MNKITIRSTQNGNIPVYPNDAKAGVNRAEATVDTLSENTRAACSDEEPAMEVGMFEIRRTLYWAVLLVSLSITAYAHAGDYSCTIMAPTQNDRWVIIYDADADGNRGKVIWKGKIEAGQKVAVTSTDGHIRYQYAAGPDDPYEGDTSVGCYQKKTILLP